MNGEHWLLYTSDREFGGMVVEGIFDSADEAWEHYRKTYDDQNDRYYRIPSVEQWKNEVKQENPQS